MAGKKIPNIDRLIIASYRYLNNVLALLIVFWLIRLFDVFVIARAFHFPSGYTGSHLLGLLYDSYFVLKVAAIFFLPYLLLSLLRKQIAQGFFITVALVLVVANLLLAVYFASTKVMLGSDLFGYSIAEIKETLQSSGSMSVVNVIPVVVFPILFLVIRHYLVKVRFPNICYYFFYPILGVAFLTNGYSVANASSGLSSSLASNKLGYLSIKTYDYIVDLGVMENAKKGVIEVGTGDVLVGDAYVSKDYPLLRKNSTRDVLSPFFDTTKVKPNIVFILVESLGRAYSGDRADYGSFTPFLDSLSKEGLYFENFLSATGRTFGVLPSLLGSLPLVNRGFMELGSSMPAHTTLLTHLHNNGYKSFFVYGGDASFDNMKQFLQRQEVDGIVDSHSFGSQYEKLPPNSQGYSWGYGDSEIFRKVVELQKVNDKAPTVSIALTLAMHDPFRVKDQDRYIRKVNRFIRISALPIAKQSFISQYVKQLSTVMYFDDALKSFFMEYAKLPTYRNTIFIITGDHRMPEIPMATSIDRFRVPLLIYSPMLKRSASIASVSTHFDVTPSLVELLNTKAGIAPPKLVSWIGAGIDTMKTFRNTHSVPLMENKNEQTSFLDGDYFIAQGKLFALTPRLGLIDQSNADLYNKIAGKLDKFKQISAFVCSNNRVSPDSLLVVGASKQKSRNK